MIGSGKITGIPVVKEVLAVNKGSFRMAKQLLALAVISLIVLLVACLSTGVPSTSAPVSPAPPTTASSGPVSPAPTTTVTSAPQGAASALPDIVSVVAKVKPSVVAIDDQISATTRRGGTTTQAAAGSGWITDSNGLIVTNDHVVSGAQNIVVSLDDGRIFTAVKVSSDLQGDVILTVDGKHMTNASQLADVISSSQIGQKLQIVYQRGNNKSTAEVTTAQNPTS